MSVVFLQARTTISYAFSCIEKTSSIFKVMHYIVKIMGKFICNGGSKFSAKGTLY